MSKATRILNEYHIKELILRGNPQYENFYKEELIEFCKISKREIDRLNNIINELENDLKKRKHTYTNMNGSINGVAVGCFTYVLKKLQELKDSD